jgi:hypothetical protein
MCTRKSELPAHPGVSLVRFNRSDGIASSLKEEAKGSDGEDGVGFSIRGRAEPLRYRMTYFCGCHLGSMADPTHSSRFLLTYPFLS